MTDAPRPSLAFHLTEGEGPTIMFLPGYASDMEGAKALALEVWAKATGRAFLRFDYAGCGRSGGEFAEQTLAGWRDDVLAMLDQVVRGPAVLVGSSMGGWLMLLAALARPEQVRALVGIAPAPDFTDWGFSTEEKMALLREGQIARISRYSPEPTPYTARFWQSGEANRLMFGPIAFTGPVRLLQGMADPDVPWQRAQRLCELIGSADVQLCLVKDGDHRLSRPADLRLLARVVEEVLEAL